MPYNYLLESQSYSEEHPPFSLENAIVIIDEAHNI
jgi:hypothetical protein